MNDHAGHRVSRKNSSIRADSIRSLPVRERWVLIGNIYVLGGFMIMCLPWIYALDDFAWLKIVIAAAFVLCLVVHFLLLIVGTLRDAILLSSFSQSAFAERRKIIEQARAEPRQVPAFRGRELRMLVLFSTLLWMAGIYGILMF